MGLDSPWVVEHPERFISLAESPFPAYTYSGPDLSSDPRVGIFIADQYYDRSDAAVVFKRLDRATGEARYIYHGNDGTSLPWNDTAQLDYTRADVREAMISTVIDVARRFPIIRFDAAMTLARRHVQRLWHPVPGTGGAVPSRSGRGMTPAELDRAMPGEVWRELVDRVLEEAPDTLLLAEAFWLMEGYFVRTLGMHRVYNSAFMHMLRDEDNARLREVLRRILEHDPAMLSRFVNFLTTPDERPASQQLGTGDRYFGACALMAAMPGTPMLGHGQVEGLSERYGMEYGRAQLDERPDSEMVARHRREILPLLRMRSRFSSSDGFRLYDLERSNGSGRDVDDQARVDENVIAFVNRAPGSVCVVLMNNSDRRTRGFLRRSAPFRDAATDSVVREDLSASLGLEAGRGGRCRLRDAVTGAVQHVAVESLLVHGLEVELGPYEHRALIDIEQVGD
jgi:hypothetical protein